MLLTIADLENPNPADLELLRGVGDVLDEQLYFEECNPKEDRAPGIHASEISHCCRQTFYTCMGFEKKIERPRREIIRWARKFAQGKAIHENLQGTFERYADRSNGLFSFVREASINPSTCDLAEDFNIHSSCDGVITLRRREENKLVDVARMALEIKSSSASVFDTLQRPQHDHLLQAHVYMACLDIPVSWLLYYNKGTENITSLKGPFMVVFDQNIWADVLDRLVLCKTAVDQRKIPEREEGLHCMFCKYAWVCQPPKFKGKAVNIKRRA